MKTFNWFFMCVFRFLYLWRRHHSDKIAPTPDFQQRGSPILMWWTPPSATKELGPKSKNTPMGSPNLAYNDAWIVKSCRLRCVADGYQTQTSICHSLWSAYSTVWSRYRGSNRHNDTQMPKSIVTMKNNINYTKRK